MNIAVAEGADEGKRFIEYVEYLADNGYVPPGGKGWVDQFIYEFPARVPSSAAGS
jgi:hypothetical protein